MPNGATRSQMSKNSQNHQYSLFSKQQTISTVSSLPCYCVSTLSCDLKRQPYHDNSSRVGSVIGDGVSGGCCLGLSGVHSCRGLQHLTSQRDRKLDQASWNGQTHRVSHLLPFCLTLVMLNLFEKLYKYISFFLIISQHWEEVGTLNPPWWSYSQYHGC